VDSVYIVASRWRGLCRNITDYSFTIEGKSIEKVSSYPHLGHIINSKFDDSDDIQHTRTHFIGQTNRVLCFFNKLDLSAKIRLFNAYCGSIYGCEWWSLEADNVQIFAVHEEQH